MTFPYRIQVTKTMKTLHDFKRKTIAPVIAAMGISLISGASYAADYPERIASEERSRRVGVGLDEVPLLSRAQGPGAEKVASQLLSRFHSLPGAVHTSDRYQKEVTKNQIALVSDEGWHLQVFADGSSVRYRNYRYLNEAGAKLARPVAERFSQEELEKLGRNFIEENLRDWVTLGDGEQLVPFFSEFEVTGGGSTKAGARMDPEMVHASTVVFTRTVGELPVVGGGSKIAVIFANDGQPVGFDFDWPRYEKTGRSQKVLSLNEIKKRGEAYSPFKVDDAAVKDLHFDCGYVDFGARKRDFNAPVQAGCLRQAAKKSIIDREAYAKDKNSGHVISASLDYFPAGATVEPDAVWESALKPGGAEPPPAGTR
ncbi:conserved protein of unknown function [Methylocaldum szegediense]|jgi:hypothetical protein|uniref:Uncharacterized protein n=2 Tax=Methylocaldum szegediense TaxID=73780 RepID=A0ABM9HZ62_9GAMM|nr:conserved protein of unknown function [Methylocaldum szegediense]